MNIADLRERIDGLDDETTMLASQSATVVGPWAAAVVVGDFYSVLRKRYLAGCGIDLRDRLTDLESETPRTPRDQ